MTEHPSGLTIRAADLSNARPPRWAWEERIVLEALNLVLGSEGIGKGTLAAWMIARLTHGELPGDLYGEPVTVGVLGDEDSWEGVWTPRLHAAGADLDRVKAIARPDGGYVELSDDRENLAKAIEFEHIKVLYLDCLIDHLGVNVDDWRSKQVRSALQPLRSIAREFGVAAIGSMHPNKRGGTFRELVSGSAAFNALSRSSLLLGQHPEEEHRRVLVRGKGNLSQTPQAVEFDIEAHHFEANGYMFSVPNVAKGSTSDLTADDLIATAPQPATTGEARNTARALIAEILADGEWHEAGPIIATCVARGIHERAARRAADDLGVDRGPVPGSFPARWRWRLTGRRMSHESSGRSVRAGRSAEPASLTGKDSTDTSDRADYWRDHLPDGWTNAELQARIEAGGTP